MEKIYFNESLIAIRIRQMRLGSSPVTARTEPLQLLTLKHAKGKHIKAHLHLPKKRMTKKLQECLVIRRGKIKVELYTSHGEYIKYLYLMTGDVFILINGGYGIHFLTDSELIEVKNGPYVEDKHFIS